MPVIGTFSAIKDGYAGTIRTLTMRDVRRWTNGLPGAIARLGASLALRGLSVSQCRMCADTHPGPEHQCSTPEV
jgi:hypothetical protein